MGHIAHQRESSIVGRREVALVMKQPTGSGAGREILVRQETPPSWKVLDRLESAGDQCVGIGLFDSPPVQWCVTFVR